MADLPTISVILPTCDRPQLLSEAAGSVLAQTLLPDQVVVVNDGGTSGNEMLRVARLRRYGGEVVVVRGSGRGPGAARNTGLRVAEGELVAFLDDDDLWHPRKTELQVEAFSARPSLGVLGTDVAPRTGVPQARPAHAGAVSVSRLRAVPLGALVRGNRLVMSSVMARRQWLEECGGFDESLALAQDWDLWLRVAARREVAVLAQPLVHYRRHQGQRSADLMAMRWWEGEVVRRALARGLPGEWLAAVARRRLAWSHVRLGRLLARAGEAEQARGEFGEAMALVGCNPVAWMGLMRCAVDRRVAARS